MCFVNTILSTILYIYQPFKKKIPTCTIIDFPENFPPAHLFCSACLMVFLSIFPRTCTFISSCTSIRYTRVHQPTLIQNYNMGFDSGGGAAPPLPLIAQLSKLFSGCCQRALPACLPHWASCLYYMATRVPISVLHSACAII